MILKNNSLVIIKKSNLNKLMVIFISFLFIMAGFLIIMPKIKSVTDPPSWPSSWTLIDTDLRENGPNDDHRDVHHAYYNIDSNYLYLRLECFGIPTFLNENSRFKWFIDFDCDSYLSNNNIVGGEYLFFVEDTNDDSIGDIYLLEDENDDGWFSEWEQPPNYYSSGLKTDTNIANYRIEGTNMDLYLNLYEIGYLDINCLVWATDQENANLEQAPDTDIPDSSDIPINLYQPNSLPTAPVVDVTPDSPFTVDDLVLIVCLLRLWLM